MAQTIIPTDLQVQGALTSKTFIPPAGSLLPSGTAGTGAPGNYHAPTNFGQQYEPTYKQPSETTAAADQQVIHVTRGATGTTMDFVVGLAVANVGGATVTFDLWKNGASILTGTITLTNAAGAYSLTSGTLSSTTTVAGDVFEVKVTVSVGGGTLGKGAFARLCVREDPN